MSKKVIGIIVGLAAVAGIAHMVIMAKADAKDKEMGMVLPKGAIPVWNPEGKKMYKDPATGWIYTVDRSGRVVNINKLPTGALTK